MKDSEDISTEPPPKTPTGSDAFAAARAQVAKESPEDQPPLPEPPEDTPPETTPPAEEPSPEDQPPETGPDSEALLSEDELAKLTPKERANAEKWQAKLTQKSQALAARAKEFDEWTPLIQALKENPDDVLAELAKQRGFAISKAAQETAVQTQAAQTVATLPAELQFLQPIFEQFGNQILQNIRSEIGPIKEQQTQMISEAAAAETEHTIKAFDSKYPDWKKYETQMVTIGQKFVPTAGAMTDYEYMETLYRLATADISKAEQTKKVVQRINKAAVSAESAQPGSSDERVDVTMPADWDKMTNKERIKASWDAASRGQVFKR